MSPKRSIFRATVAFVLVAAGALQGCADKPDDKGLPKPAPEPVPGTTDFISDAPSSGQSKGASNGEDDSAGSFGAGGSASSAPGAAGSGGQSTGAAGSAAEDPNDVKKTIEEADIVQVRGSRLYALSRYSGLAIIDVGDVDHFKLLGRYPLSGTPFEMYVRDNTVLAMFSDWGRYECTGTGAAQSCSWVSSSHIVALDTTDPNNPQTSGSFDLPGEISDSRLVGDVLYAVTYESGYCWNCSDKPNTTVSSIALKDLASIKQVDKVTYENPNNNGGGWWKRSISVNDQRMYVAGVEWDYDQYGNWSTGHSTIQVIDISNPSGKLAVGATVEAHGQIESRWQMDEHEGTLRVISQPGEWSASELPQIQTFAVKSAYDVKPIAAVNLTLPKPERLRSVRFDGDRAFAVTAEQTDPLFTFDIKDPANPKQVGSLEMPGWVYHMEPRGDRLLALGFDNGNKEGSLAVSLFDVSKLDQPSLLKRVNFGGDWGSFAEDQDRIQKAFSILDDQKLILVPFAGWSSTKGPNGEYWGCGSYQSGIQLVDFDSDSLVKRGVAPQKGQSRRALLKDGRLLALSDDKLTSFDITNRDVPLQRSETGLSHKVSRTLPVGDQVVRLTADWWTGEALLDVVPLASADSVESSGRLDLSSVTGKDSNNCYGSSIYNAQLLANGTTLTLVWGDYAYYGYEDGYYGGNNYQPTTHVVTVSIADPTKPTLLGHADLPFALGSYGYYGYYGDSVYYGDSLQNAGKSIVQLGSTIAISRTDYDYSNSTTTVTSRLELVDLSDPTKPAHSATLDLPGSLYQTGLQISANQLFTSHAEAVPGQDGKVRYYLDRLDVSNPAAPAVVSKVNVPGSPLRLDNDGKLVSVDYKRTVTSASSWEDCYGTGYYYYGGVWFDSQNNQCVHMKKVLRLSNVSATGATLLDSHSLDADGFWVNSVAFDKDRLFGVGYAYDSAATTVSQRLIALGGLTSDHFDTSTVTLATPAGWYYGTYDLVGISEGRAVLSSYDGNDSTLSTVDLDAPEGQQIVERGSLLTWASDLQIVGSSAIASLQERGVQVLPLK